MSLLSLYNVRRGLRHPSHVVMLARSIFPWRALSQDPECAHLIKSWRSGKAPRKTIQDVFPGVDTVDVVLRVPYRRVIGTATDLGEVACLASVMRFMGARRVLEIGTNDGFNALNLAANLVDDADAFVSTLDLPVDEAGIGQRAAITNACDPHVVGAQFRGQREARRIRQFYGDSTVIDWSTLGGPFDLIFIDGCHDRSFVERDTANALKNLAPGGVIFWHDYGAMPDVSDAVDARFTSSSVVAIRGTRLAVYKDSRPHDRSTVTSPSHS